jgi:hypothetical protein
MGRDPIPGQDGLKAGALGAETSSVANETTRAISRRAVSWDPALGVLTVGERAVTLTCAAGDNECILRTYLHLVAEQREVALDRSVVLRRDDVLVLAELLDLDDVRLEHKLARILRLSDPEAKELRRELLRQRVTVAAMGVGLVAGIPLVGMATADAATSPATNGEVVRAGVPGEALPASPTTTEVTVEVATVPTLAPTAAAPVAAASTPEPPAEPPAEAADEPTGDVEIGYSVTYERDPDFVPPDGVEIGDAMVIERELP